MGRGSYLGGVTVGAYTAPAIPITPPPAPAPAAAPGVGAGSNAESSSTTGTQSGPSLVYQVADASSSQGNQNGFTNSQQSLIDDAAKATDPEESSVEDLFGDQTLLDMLADLG